MSNNIIILPKTVKEYRQKCVFRCSNVKIKDEDGKIHDYPCICLWDDELEVPICYTGLERYLYRYAVKKRPKGSTLPKRANAVCKLLNYLLWNTDLNSIHECNLTVIRAFLVQMKYKGDGTELNSKTWIKYWNHIADFLEIYYDNNKEVLDFKYGKQDFRTEKENFLGIPYRSHRYDQTALLHINPPTTVHRKNRFLVEGYFKLLLYEAEAWDKELALAIGLGGYGGLREGETVNTTPGRIKTENKGPYESMESMYIDLTSIAPHFANWTKKTDPGSIKKIRKQEIYMPFVSKIKKLFNEHLAYHCSMGYSISDDAPLFVNKRGEPMTVQTYSRRMKDLFYDHFIPDLITTCERQNTYADNAAYIEAYLLEYPGLHMLRHWFTMYLKTRTNLEKEDIKNFRGDDSMESMNDYLHVNSDMIEMFRQSNYVFQKQILEDMRVL